MKGLLVIIAIVLLTGCVTYPESVKVPEGTQLASFESVNQANSQLNDQQARWSGVIAEITNLSKQTRLEVLYYPPEGNGRPKTKGEPAGRYRVYVDKFLEPEIYKKGKSITVLGKVANKELAKIGEFEYEYPTLQQSTVYLWPKKRDLTKVEFYYGWHGYHPRYYWHGGARHVYVVGKSGKKVPSQVSKKKPPRN